MERRHGIGLGEATRVWALVGLNSFGGPAGQIAVMHRMLVEERRWFGERRFLHALNYCMLLPGPEAQQLATYFGWLLHGVRGGLIAGSLFVLPGFALVLALSLVYAGHGDTALVEAVFYGIKPAVLALVVYAVARIGSRVLGNRVLAGLAAAAFVAIFFFDVPFPLIVAGAALVGWLGGRRRPEAFTGALADEDGWGDGEGPRVRPSLRRGAGVLALGLALWWGPVLALAAWLGRESVYVQEGTFFSVVALVSFGGAYAVLAYVAQEAVQTYGWVTPGEMLDGLGMAETTPGPLILVVQFVGFMGAYRFADGVDPLLAGTAGAVLVAWVTFVPCFLWIFLGAPYVEYLRGNRALGTALAGVTAAVVGVIVNLAVWFGLHVVFADVDEERVGPLRLYAPEWSSFDPVAAALTAGALVLVFVLRFGLLRTLGVSALVGGALSLTGIA